MAVEMLSESECEDTWAIGCAINGLYVPDEVLQAAMDQGRVAFAYSTSSMGTADTCWQLVSSLATYERWREDLVAWPEGHVFSESDFESYDDRDVDRVLWKWFYRTLKTRALQAIPRDCYEIVVTEYARVLAALERAWMRGSTERDGLIALLERDRVERREIDELLVTLKDSVRHLQKGLRARWILCDPEDLYEGCITSLERFGQTRRPPITRAGLHHELVQVAVRVARGRPWRSVAW